MKRVAIISAAAALAWTTSIHPGIAASQVDPASLVDPLVGTSSTFVGGPIDTFPGADAPFGMVQWSPDTPSQPAGGGYNYYDGQITGFSLTHLSGPGCSVFGDIGILPVAGPLTDPTIAKQPFAHAGEEAQPGFYSVWLGQPSVHAALTVTTRTGLGEFTFPRTPEANVLVNASSDQAGVLDADVQIKGDREVVGSASSGWFCGMPDAYTVYFALEFDRPFASYGMWRVKKVMPGASESHGAGSGGWVTFDASSDQSVEVKASISWVSIAGAEANLRAEATTWDVDRERFAARTQWSKMLGRVAISGGSAEEQRTFYTALYHAFLHPNVFSDADGSYRGFDGQVHRVDPGHAEYGTFSGWDIYRTEIPLLALLAPSQTSDMMRSLVHAASQSGWLPKWSLVNGETSVMGGDPADPIIAGAYAFGARDFDVRSALAAMLRGATEVNGPLGQGWYQERPGLDEYLKRGYVVNDHTTNVSPVPNGASLTLEYALDDFSISELAQAAGQSASSAQMLARAQNWSTIFDTALGTIAPRDSDGAFEETPIGANGQSGFQEGNAAQYTWMVPQNLGGLIDAMGGPASAQVKLDAYFSQINAGQNVPFAWLGNEPSLGSPWVYLSADAPWKAQRIVRAALTQLYADTPDGIPGNDDLGTMSAWYVWCAIGLYPQNPAAPVLDIGSPLFSSISIRVPHGASIDIRAPQAADTAAYIRALRVDGRMWSKSWLPLRASGTTRLDFTLASSPNLAWASAAADAPPSYSAGALKFPAATAATLALSPASGLSLAPGGSASIQLTLSNPGGTNPAIVSWQASALPQGFALDSTSGVVTTAPGASVQNSVRLSVSGSAASGLYDVSFAGQADNGALLARESLAIRVARPGDRLALAYAANFLDNTITPIDPRTFAVGEPIAVGQNPGNIVLSPDGSRVYTTNQGSNDVTVIDTATQAAIATVKVGRTPSGIVVSPDGKTVWVVNNGDNTVQPIDAATLTAGPPIAVGLSPQDAAITPDGTRLYVADQGSNEVTPIDVRSATAAPVIEVGRRPVDIVVSPDGKTAFVADQGDGAVTPIDVATGAAGAEIPAGVAPQGLAVSPDGRLLFVADSGSDTVTPIDLAARSAQAPIVVGWNPSSLAFDRTGSTLFVSDLGDGDCVPVDVATKQVGARIAAGNWPLALAF
jgi:predicted alpha-1,2-mannosidase